MSTEGMFWARSFRTGKPHLRLVLILLGDGCGSGGEIDIDLPRLAFETEMSEAEAEAAVHELMSLGAIELCADGEWSNRLALPQEIKAPLLTYGVSPSMWASLRRQTFDRDGFACTYCGSSEAPLHCDHVIPFSKGGGTVLSNLTTACKTCNVSKRARTPSEWRGA
jgi:hypothetical protein